MVNNEKKELIIKIKKNKKKNRLLLADFLTPIVFGGCISLLFRPTYIIHKNYHFILMSDNYCSECFIPLLKTIAFACFCSCSIADYVNTIYENYKKNMTSCLSQTNFHSASWAKYNLYIFIYRTWCIQIY